MEKSSPSSGSDGSRELQCVGQLEIVSPKPVGFLCGSIPVPTDKAFHSFNSAIIASSQKVRAPRYRMLPTKTNLNMPPHISNLPDKVLPIGAVPPKNSDDFPWETAITSNLTKKCEALAVSGLVEYGDEIDVIAPADILKQIFKMPYSKGRLSIAVHRIGQTLVLNTGPDIEEGEKLVRRSTNQPKCADQSLFLNFAMHSVRVEACDCPPNHNVSAEEQSKSSVLPGLFESGKGSFQCSDYPQGDRAQYFGQSDGIAREDGSKHHSGYPQVKQDNYLWRSKKSKRNKGHDPIKKDSQVGEKPRCPVQESEKYRRVSNDGFLRVLFWQFHNFRMLLGSDLLLFSNEKYVAVSLHLWDVTRQVTPLTWLEAWLDNVMASVPELAICYHQNGVVQGYELLKTDDIFLLKGISEDGTPAFHPHVVHQNGLSVLRFLQENCKQDPGSYWLYKSAGEDMIQLFDLSVIPKNNSSDDGDDNSSSFPTLINRGRSDSVFSLGILLYRIAHRLSLSMGPNNMAKCASFFKKCFDFLDEPDHLVMRAIAHEQFARLILNCDEELGFTSESLPSESKIIVADADEESLDLLTSTCESIEHERVSYLDSEDIQNKDENSFPDSLLEASVKMPSEATLSSSKNLIASVETELKDSEEAFLNRHDSESFAMDKTSLTSTCMVKTVTDPISSKLAAVHHVSQAIKSLRWMRQLQSIEPEMIVHSNITHDRNHRPINFSVCACGDADCIEVCDIREWLPTSKLDHKLWKLVLLLGESYLALGEAYKENGKLHQALKVVELACSIYGSMPQHLEETRFISSMVCRPSSETNFSDRCKQSTSIGDSPKLSSTPGDARLSYEQQQSSTYLFWVKAWTLVGDVYIEFHMIKSKEILKEIEMKPPVRELRMSSEVVKEVKRLKKKLGQYKQNCSSCSLVNCSCQSDRANSGSSASSSSGDMHPSGYGRKPNRKSSAKSSSNSVFGEPKEDHDQYALEHKNSSESGYSPHNRDGDISREASNVVTGNLEEKPSAITNSEEVEDNSDMHKIKSKMRARPETAPTETAQVKNGGIFKYLGGPVVGDADCNLTTALSCYEEARTALGGLPRDSSELQAALRKIGWVCNELGRNRLERKELDKAEVAFADAINAFKEVCDYTNIILINCNLGHGRRALAEEMVLKIENLKRHAIFCGANNQALETAKLEYSESLKYYGAAKSELNVMGEEAGALSSSLKNEVYTQYAHTYLRLGMLLAREGIVAEVYESGALEDASTSQGERRAKKELRRHEISANDAIREALSIYESLGELRKQEAAYAYFQLACYQRDCCLKFLEPDHEKRNLAKGENSLLQRVKQYASLAERHWQKAIDFYGPKTHPAMYLTILIERSALLLSLSSPFHTNAMLESALSSLLEARHVSGNMISDTLTNDYTDVNAKFWSQLQMVLKRMLAAALATSTAKSSLASQPTAQCNRSLDVGKLRELYKMSLKSTDVSRLHAIYSLWTL